MISSLKQFVWKILKWIRVFIIYRFLKKTTYGVRVLVIDRASDESGEINFSMSKIFLIKHPYDNFWVLPGGGRKKEESILKTAKREVEEETGLILEGDLERLGRYFNNKEYKNDYIDIVVAHSWKKSHKRRRLIDKIEIQKRDWFNLNQLPTISVATQKRIKEYLDNDFSDEIRDWA